MLYYLLVALVARPIRLEITESVVRVRRGGGRPDLEVPRQDIRAIHYFPRMIGFRGPGDEPLTKIYPDHTQRQMRTVAELLRVPLYDHERWHGQKGAGEGRLVCDPAASDRVS